MLSSITPEAVFFNIGPLAVHWYGVILSLGALLGYFSVLRLAKNKPIKKTDLSDLFFYLLVFGFLGARVYEVFFIDPKFYFQNPGQILAVWNGGLAIHGGIVVGILVVYFFSKKRNLSFWELADILSPGVVLAQAIGRWGNFFNQELFGRPTDIFWKIFIKPENRPEIYYEQSYFHPTFLYESILNFILFVLLYFAYRNSRFRPGIVFIFYLMGYAIIRFGLEFIRIDPTPQIIGLRLPQIASIFIFVAAGWFFYQRGIKKTGT